MRPITAAEMLELDRKASEFHGLSPQTLMENAGLAVAEFVAGLVRPSSRIPICCGKGNNGGDGLAAARFLAQHGFSPEVFLLEDPQTLKPAAAANYKRLGPLGVKVQALRLNGDWTAFDESLSACSWVVDAILGIGTTRPLEEPYLTVVNKINRSAKRIVAVDIPSGLNADTGEVCGAAVRADYTLTLGVSKKGLYAARGPMLAGQIEIMDIGLPPALLRPFAI